MSGRWQLGGENYGNEFVSRRSCHSSSLTTCNPPSVNDFRWIRHTTAISEADRFVSTFDRARSDFTRALLQAPPRATEDIALVDPALYGSVRFNADLMRHLADWAALPGVDPVAAVPAASTSAYQRVEAEVKRLDLLKRSTHGAVEGNQNEIVEVTEEVGDDGPGTSRSPGPQDATMGNAEATMSDAGSDENGSASDDEAATLQMRIPIADLPPAVRNSLKCLSNQPPLEPFDPFMELSSDEDGPASSKAASTTHASLPNDAPAVGASAGGQPIRRPESMPVFVTQWMDGAFFDNQDEPEGTSGGRLTWQVDPEVARRATIMDEVIRRRDNPLGLQLPYTPESLTWDEEHVFNEEEQYGYTGETFDTEHPMLKCDNCKLFFHLHTVKAVSGPVFWGDDAYDFVCARPCCGNGVETWKRRKQRSWIEITRLALLNLIMANRPNNKRHFRFRGQLCKYISQHWGTFCLGRPHRELWVNAVSAALTTNRAIFQSGEGAMKEKGFWTLTPAGYPTWCKFPLPFEILDRAARKGKLTASAIPHWIRRARQRKEKELMMQGLSATQARKKSSVLANRVSYLARSQHDDDDDRDTNMGDEDCESIGSGPSEQGLITDLYPGQLVWVYLSDTEGGNDWWPGQLCDCVNGLASILLCASELAVSVPLRHIVPFETRRPAVGSLAALSTAHDDGATNGGCSEVLSAPDAMPSYLTAVMEANAMFALQVQAAAKPAHLVNARDVWSAALQGFASVNPAATVALVPIQASRRPGDQFVVSERPAGSAAAVDAAASPQQPTAHKKRKRQPTSERRKQQRPNSSAADTAATSNGSTGATDGVATSHTSPDRQPSRVRTKAVRPPPAVDTTAWQRPGDSLELVDGHYIRASAEPFDPSWPIYARQFARRRSNSKGVSSSATAQSNGSATASPSAVTSAGVHEDIDHVAPIDDATALSMPAPQSPASAQSWHDGISSLASDTGSESEAGLGESGAAGTPAVSSDVTMTEAEAEADRASAADVAADPEVAAKGASFITRRGEESPLPAQPRRERRSSRTRAGSAGSKTSSPVAQKTETVPIVPEVGARQRHVENKRGKAAKPLKEVALLTPTGETMSVSLQPGEEILEIDRLEGHRKNPTSGRVEYLVKWVGYESCTWEPEDNILDQSLLNEYHQKAKATGAVDAPSSGSSTPVNAGAMSGSADTPRSASDSALAPSSGRRRRRHVVSAGLRDPTSQFKGVSRVKQQWRAAIIINGSKHIIGTYCCMCQSRLP